LPAKTQALIKATSTFDPNEILHHWSPKKIVSSWQDQNGIRRLVVVFSTTTGLKEDDKSGVDIKVTKDGLELTLSEKWDNFVLDTESFYHVFPKDPRETDDEFTLRKTAMMNTVKKLRTCGHGAALTSVYRYKLPFRVDPEEKRVTCIASGNSRVVHIDLAERKRIDGQEWLQVKQSKRVNAGASCEFSNITD
jgi:hypothetical protein